MKFSHLIACAATLALGGTGHIGTAFAKQADAVSVDQQQQGARAVLLISIDGLSPDSLFQADALGLKIPTLRRLMQQGATARRMINVNPTVTNPNHTTMITGVSPRIHGVFNNRPFSPSVRLPSGYRRYGDIKVPTLWSAAKAAGLRTASLYWPVTQDAHAIDFNILDGSSADDNQITRDAIAIMEREKPELMTVHYVSHDGAQHQFGPRTPEAFASLERIDAAIGRLIEAQQKIYHAPIVAVASDHGFFKIQYRVHLNSAFVDAGLITLDESRETGVRDWRAFAWYVGGMAMVVLKDPQDRALKSEVYQFLSQLVDREDVGIERIYSEDELQGLGLSPQAQYVIALKDGHHMGLNMEGPLRLPFKGGAHGAFSNFETRPEMHSAFILAGRGIQSGQDLGVVDMRQIAPTLAEFLALDLPSAEKPSIALVHTEEKPER